MAASAHQTGGQSYKFFRGRGSPRREHADAPSSSRTTALSYPDETEWAATTARLWTNRVTGAVARVTAISGTGAAKDFVDETAWRTTPRRARSAPSVVDEDLEVTTETRRSEGTGGRRSIDDTALRTSISSREKSLDDELKPTRARGGRASGRSLADEISRATARSSSPATRPLTPERSVGAGARSARPPAVTCTLLMLS